MKIARDRLAGVLARRGTVRQRKGGSWAGDVATAVGAPTHATVTSHVARVGLHPLALVAGVLDGEPGFGCKRCGRFWRWHTVDVQRLPEILRAHVKCS